MADIIDMKTMILSRNVRELEGNAMQRWWQYQTVAKLPNVKEMPASEIHLPAFV